MIYIASTIIWLLLSIILHIFIVKLRFILKISPLKAVLVFFVGLIGCLVTNLFILNPSEVSLPYSSILLFISLAAAYAGITGSPSLGDQSPTTSMLLYLQKKPAKRQELLLHFKTTDVLAKRMEDFVGMGFIEKKKGRYFLTSKGKQMAKIFKLYRQILGLSEGG